jgi:F0F1-type ATP synthase assembly protein I
MSEQRPAASAATAGIYLLVALVTCVALGFGAGSLLGASPVGAVVGAVVGIPVSFYLVYRQYRDF